MTDYVKNLQSGMELYFVSARRVGKFPKWYRMPMLSKREARDYFVDMISDPQIKDLAVYNENDLNDTITIHDPAEPLVPITMTKREYLFGSNYQQAYEMTCVEAGVSLEPLKVSTSNYIHG